jgi:HSP20 family protein
MNASPQTLERRITMSNENANIARGQASTPERVRQRATLQPVVDVYENQDELLLVADVPGARNDGVSVHLDNNQLTIEARRVDDSPPGSALITESRSYDYFRAFTVPRGIDASKIEAQLTGGVLWLHLPKSEALKPRRIEVKAG